jgi:hypothetical protein
VLVGGDAGIGHVAAASFREQMLTNRVCKRKVLNAREGGALISTRPFPNCVYHHLRCQRLSHVSLFTGQAAVLAGSP